MRENTQQVLHWVGISEGGYSNDPHDIPTNHGITQLTLDAWQRRHGLKTYDVKNLTKVMAEKIFVDQYFHPVRFDDLPSGLDYAVVDYAINSGPAKAAKALQAVLGITQDGVIGNHTLAAIVGSNRVLTIVDLCSSRMRFLKRLSKWKYYGKGWTIRVVGNHAGQQDDDIGVLDRAVKMAQGITNIPAQLPPVDPSGKGDGPQSMGWLMTLLKLIFGGKK